MQEFTKEEMIIIIRADEQYEAMLRNFKKAGLTISSDMSSDVLRLEEVIQNHSKYAGREDDDALNQFRAILYAENIIAEKKYEMLIL